MKAIEKIHKRQLARFLDYLEAKGDLTPVLATDIKRCFGFIFQDVNLALQEQGKDNKNEPGLNQ